MTEPDDDPVTLAKVIDLGQARARRDEAAKQAEDARQAEAAQNHRATHPDVDHARLAAESRRQRENTAQKRRRLVERTARNRAAAATQRIQHRVADRLARIEAELDAEIARLRLAYAQQRRRGAEGLWIWPTVAASILALVVGLAYFAGTQRTYAASAAVAPLRVAAKQVSRPTVRSGGATGRTGAGPQRSPSVPSSGGSTSGTPYRPALPASGPGCGGTPYKSMSAASASIGGTP